MAERQEDVGLSGCPVGPGGGHAELTSRGPAVEHVAGDGEPPGSAVERMAGDGEPPGPAVEHVTKDGTRYRLAAERYRELVASLRTPPTRGMWFGAALPVLVCALAALFQYFVAGPGLALSTDAIGSVARESDTLGVWPRHLLLHHHGTWMTVNIVLLLGFGILLGWREGVLRLLLPAAAAAVVGGLVEFLESGTEHFGLWYIAVGVLAVSMWRYPTGRRRESFIPWTLIAGSLVLVLVPRLLCGVSDRAMLPTVTAALLVGVFTLPAREMDCGRVGAVATFVAIAFVSRFSDRVFSLFEVPAALLSGGNWLGIVFDLLILVIAGIYAVSQADMLRDMRFWAVRDRLDAQVAAVGEQVG